MRLKLMVLVLFDTKSFVLFICENVSSYSSTRNQGKRVFDCHFCLLLSFAPVLAI